MYTFRTQIHQTFTKTLRLLQVAVSVCRHAVNPILSNERNSKMITANNVFKYSIAVLFTLGMVTTAQVATAEENPMLVNYGINGSWYEPATSGQGLVLDLVPSSNLLAAYWFTYPLEGGAREWYLAVGDISGDSVEFTVYQAENGVFDQVSQVETNAVGSATLHFSSCSQASWNYTLETDGISGEIPLQRIAPDYFCEEFLAMANTEVVSRSNAWVDIRGEWLFEGCVNLEDSDSHGNEQFIFTDTTASLRIDRYSQPDCQGELTQQVLDLEIQRIDKTLALLGGNEVIANRFVMTDTTNGAEIRQLIYVDDTGPAQLLTHGILGATTDPEGFPAELPELFFERVTGNP